MSSFVDRRLAPAKNSLEEIGALLHHIVRVEYHRGDGQAGGLADECSAEIAHLLGRREFAGHLRRYLWGEHLWSPSYFAGSCGGAPLAVVKEYIENQKRPGP